jgi:hypothetical protein
MSPENRIRSGFFARLLDFHLDRCRAQQVAGVPEAARMPGAGSNQASKAWP